MSKNAIRQRYNANRGSAKQIGASFALTKGDEERREDEPLSVALLTKRTLRSGARPPRRDRVSRKEDAR